MPRTPDPERADDTLVSVRIPDAMVAKLDELVEMRKWTGDEKFTRSDAFREAIRQYLDQFADELVAFREMREAFAAKFPRR